jgi:uncharacterized membrane protein
VVTSFLKTLPELIDAGLITEEKGEEIRQYFNNKPDNSQSRLIIIFSILGALLIGLGVILILAHNWDEFSRPVKTIFAFLPLLIGQSVGIYVILGNASNVGMREGAGAFLFCAVGASISLVSQIYNIPGNLSSFLLTWMWLCLPVVYLLKSNVTAMFIIAVITFYASETSYWGRHYQYSWGYWLVIAGLIPNYLLLLTRNIKGNYYVVMSWLLLLSVTICLGTLADQSGEFMYISYFSWFGICLFLGEYLVDKGKNYLSNPCQVIGWAGTVVMLLMLSFDWFWDDLANSRLSLLSIELGSATVITILAIWLLGSKMQKISWKAIQFIELIFVLFVFAFILGRFYGNAAMVVINLLVLTLGLLTVRQGARKNHLGILNFGLLIVTALILCRFFDADISFVARGIMFVLVGAGFFAGNYFLIKKRKGDAL